ncbi:MAG: agmatine deiminase family protein [Parvularculaceae bacterium]
MSRRQPAEWEPHSALWSAWPADAELWADDLAPARAELASMLVAIADPDPQTGAPRGARIRLCVNGEEAEASARAALDARFCDFIQAPYGDIWVRDTGPIFVEEADGRPAAVAFRFNGWGEKFRLGRDEEMAARIAAAAGARLTAFPMVATEGGAIEVDGEGTAIVTRDSILNPNRNPGATEADIERCLEAALGVSRVIWLDRGLAGDHTDGHVDNVARFIAPGAAICMTPSGPDDPNRDVLEDIRRTLENARDASGRRLEVLALPSPGRVENADGEIMPASYMNFVISNRTVVMPQFGAAPDGEAVERLAAAMPGRRVTGSPAKHILTGGGAFHCATQQEPAWK